MKSYLLITLILMTLCVGCKKETANEQSATGQIGGQATPLTGLQWVKNGPVEFTPGQVYVVEFWATWCGPCRTSIPHLTEVQKKYQDKKVTVIGITNEPLADVQPFVEGQGDKMDYSVALDLDGTVSRGYMEAFGQDGIPHAFLVDGDGRIVWHGHPMGDLEEVLDKVLAGTLERKP